MKVVDIDDIFPTRAEIRDMDILLSNLDDLESVKKELKKESLTISER